MISTSQIHWIAGLLEGEGTFNYTTVGTDGKRGSIRVALSTTDKDILLRFANLLGFGSVCTIQPYKSESGYRGYRLQYRWDASGVRAAGLMMTIYSLMGERRKERIRELLAYYRSTKAHRTSGAQINRQFAF